MTGPTFFKKTKAGIIFYHNPVPRSVSIKKISELDISNVELADVKLSRHPWSTCTFLYKQERIALGVKGIKTLAQLAAIYKADKTIVTQNQHVLEAICHQLPSIQGGDVITSVPLKLEINIPRPSTQAAAFRNLDKELQKIILDELADRIRNLVGELVDGVHEIKRQRDIQRTEAEIKQLQARLAVLSMPTQSTKRTIDE